MSKRPFQTNRSARHRRRHDAALAGGHGRGQAGRTAGRPLRMGFFYLQNGIVPEFWFPRKAGADFELPAVARTAGAGSR